MKICNRKKRRGERGQAIAELAVSMVAIMAVFLGVLCIGALGIESIEAIIDARGQADLNSANGVLGGSGTPILEWNYGDDELYFTADDTPVGGSAEDAGFFYSQLITTDGEFVLSDDLSFDGINSYNFAENFPLTFLFLNSADLTSHTSAEADPFGEREIEDLAGAFDALFGTSDVSISETVYMPVVNTEN